MVVSGDAAGSLRAFDATGALVEMASLESGITVVRATDPTAEVAFIAATERGGVRGFVTPGSDPDVSVAPPQPENDLDLNGETLKESYLIPCPPITKENAHQFKGQF